MIYLVFFWDVLAINQLDLLTIGLGTVVLLVLKVIWRSLFAATVSPEIARAEGLRPERAEVIFMILMASVIAISMKIVGVLLITAPLIIPAASARCFSKSPEQMALYSVLVGVLSVIIGLQSSQHGTHPRGPSIVAALLLLFIASTLSMPASEASSGNIRITLVMGQCREQISHQKSDPRPKHVKAAPKPQTAYSLLEQLKEHGLKAPPQIYSALEKLLTLGLIHKLESINSFLLPANTASAPTR